MAAGVTTLLFGCVASTESTSSESAEPEAAALQVVTTFLPMTTFTQAVAGDRAQVTQLLPASADPHDYQAKPQDAQRLANADVLIENGLAFETFLSDLVENAGADDLVIIDASKGIETLSFAEADDHDDHNDHDDHDDEQAHDDHDHGDHDPHAWLDPKKAIQQVENIRDALSSADPAGADTYGANADAYVKQLQVLDQTITAALAPYAGKTFVTYHDFAGHFAHSYDLEVEHLVEVPEGSAAPGDVLKVIEAAEASNLKTLLSEPGQQNGPLEAVADDLGVSVSVFDPLETAGSDGLAPDYYIMVMTQNLANLTDAFGQAEP